MQLHHSIFGHSLKLFALIGHSPWLPKTPQASHQSFSFEHLGERVTYKKYRRPHSLHQPTSLPLCRGQWFSSLFTLLNVCASSSTLSAIISSFSARSRVTFGTKATTSHNLRAPSSDQKLLHLLSKHYSRCLLDQDLAASARPTTIHSRLDLEDLDQVRILVGHLVTFPYTLKYVSPRRLSTGLEDSDNWHESITYTNLLFRTGFGATNNTGGFGSTNTPGGGLFGSGGSTGFGSSGGTSNKFLLWIFFLDASGRVIP